MRPVVRAFFLAAMLLAASAPLARGEWSAPATVPTGGQGIEGLLLASGSAGQLLAWRTEQGPPGHMTPAASRALAAPGAPFGAARALPSSFASGPMVDLGGGRLA